MTEARQSIPPCYAGPRYCHAGPDPASMGCGHWLADQVRNDKGDRNDPQSILRGLGLLLPDGALSRAALALFCPDDVAPSDFPQFKLRLARFKGTTRDEFLDNRQYAGNAFALMRRAERFLIDWLPVASKIVPDQMARIDTPALPTEATVIDNNGFVIMTFAIPDKYPDGKKTLGKTLGKTPDLILTSLSDAPGASIPQLAQQLDKSSSAIERAIRKLCSEGKLVRIDLAKGGHWKVLNKP